ncbi:MAG: YigZ family protein [Candidatus Onthovivens sp.]|nr:YigZ family protein [Mollicutes bacterium]MDD7591736.1 YigZ family protein [Bacilli bacterium]MDY4214701.1 YigZ family protein [Candidatus Onthovivens sp.]MCI7633393.1 YigZ family protein [Mollicutes bacterium]MCI7797285.1 YigZ family protein [Mollicutes bacterium]
MKKILTIKEEYEDKIEVSKSQFYSFLIPLSSEEEVPLLIKEKRMQFVKARHVCYAYIFNSNYKYSDDGEPSGTAGKPLYELLNKNNLTNCILIVVRIFGGVLLGAGRLLRTYVESGLNSIKKANKFEIYYEFLIKLEIKLENINIIKGYLVKYKYEIKNVIYDEISTIEFYSSNDVIKELNNNFYGMILQSEIKKVERLREYKDE